jgi:NitT/TauT family transport system permease protein
VEIRQPLSNQKARGLALAGLAVFLGSWAVLSYAEIIPNVILPSPTDVLRAFPILHFEEALVRSAGWSIYRVTMGFVLSALVAIPLGLLMGTFPPVKRFFAPLFDPLRFLPISALVPLTIVWFGIEEMQKIIFLFMGTFVYLLPLVVEAVESVDEVYLQTATTLGATKTQTVTQVLIPGSLPAIAEALRVMNGIGWTYVILAEVINARYGLGALITVAGKRSHVDQIFALVLVILAIGVVSDFLIRWINRRLFFWRG